MSNHQENLERVKSNISGFVLDFVRGREGSTFYASELRSYVQKRHGTAPASPDRILRDLRQKGFLNYKVVSRSQSLYKVLPKKKRKKFKKDSGYLYGPNGSRSI